MCAQTKTLGIGGMDFAIRLVDVRQQAACFAGAGHGVPLVTYPACVKNERIARAGRIDRRARGDGDKTGAAIGGVKLAVGEQAGCACEVPFF